MFITAYIIFLYTGEQLIKDTVEVHQLNLQPTEAEESLVMEINVEVSTDKPILSETDQEQGYFDYIYLYIYLLLIIVYVLL